MFQVEVPALWERPRVVQQAGHKHNLCRDSGQGVTGGAKWARWRHLREGEWARLCQDQTLSPCMCTSLPISLYLHKIYLASTKISALCSSGRKKQNRSLICSLPWPLPELWTASGGCSNGSLAPSYPTVICLLGEEQCQNPLLLWDLEWLFNIKSRIESQPGIPHSSSASKVFQIGYGQARIGFLRSRK